MREQAVSVLAAAAALEEVRRRELDRVTRALDAAGLPALVLKGAAWAYSHYDRPELRPRSDTDLLIAPASREAAGAALAAIGYRPMVESVMRVGSSQRHYACTDAHGTVHAIDLHWRAVDRLAFEALPFEPAWARSVRLAPFAAARALCEADAVQLAAIHRIAHHGAQSRLLWVFDLHRLAAAMTADAWADLMSAASSPMRRACCARGLARAAGLFGTPLPEAVMPWIARGMSDPLPDAFAGRGIAPLDALRSDWHAAGWRSRLLLAKDHLLPPREYVRARFGGRRGWTLPLAYARRILSGAPRWLTRSPRAR